MAGTGSREEAAQEQDGDTVAGKLENVSRFPRHGWMVSLDHTFPEKRDQKIRPRIGQLPQLIPLFMR
ncbi:hypothetical protein E2C01_073078 [Portunus trituberculatus]|uniref:Uncharacterized protein n=4 Tax=Portunus trituberculatus TaxID=210409 RepID=A0A5B7IAQ2_PORTR|nr:hypothetical protein [Portunus trituberculatus]